MTAKMKCAGCGTVCDSIFGLCVNCTDKEKIIEVSERVVESQDAEIEQRDAEIEGLKEKIAELEADSAEAWEAAKIDPEKFAEATANLNLIEEMLVEFENIAEAKWSKTQGVANRLRACFSWATQNLGKFEPSVVAVSLKMQLDRALEDKKNLHIVIEKLKKKSEIDDAAIETLESRLRSAESMVGQLKTANDALMTNPPHEIKSLEAALQNRQAKIDQLMEKVDEQRAKLTVLDCSHNDLSRLNKRLVSERDAQNEYFHKITEALSHPQSSTLTGDEVLEHIRRMVISLNSVDSRNREVQRRNQDLVARLNRLEEKLGDDDIRALDTINSKIDHAFDKSFGERASTVQRVEAIIKAHSRNAATLTQITGLVDHFEQEGPKKGRSTKGAAIGNRVELALMWAWREIKDRDVRIERESTSPPVKNYLNAVISNARRILLDISGVRTLRMDGRDVDLEAAPIDVLADCLRTQLVRVLGIEGQVKTSTKLGIPKRISDRIVEDRIKYGDPPAENSFLANIERLIDSAVGTEFAKDLSTIDRLQEAFDFLLKAKEELSAIEEFLADEAFTEESFSNYPVMVQVRETCKELDGYGGTEYKEAIKRIAKLQRELDAARDELRKAQEQAGKMSTRFKDAAMSTTLLDLKAEGEAKACRIAEAKLDQSETKLKKAKRKNKRLAKLLKWNDRFIEAVECSVENDGSGLIEAVYQLARAFAEERDFDAENETLDRIQDKINGLTERAECDEAFKEAVEISAENDASNLIRAVLNFARARAGGGELSVESEALHRIQGEINDWILDGRPE